MNTIGDVLGALKSVILLQTRVEQLDGEMKGMASDIDGLVAAMSAIRDRVSRLEGVIEGAAMAQRNWRIQE